MTGEYDPQADAFASYYAAVEAKRLRGDTHWGPRWRIVSPAPCVAALGLAGAHARVRRLVLRQVRDGDSVAIYRGDDLMAVAMFGLHGWRRVEMALAVSPAAAGHMKRLVRMAHLTLSAMADSSLIVASVRPGNRAGERMAAMVGFVPARLSRPGYWIFRKADHGDTSRRRQFGGETRGGTAEAGTARRQ